MTFPARTRRWGPASRWAALALALAAAGAGRAQPLPGAPEPPRPTEPPAVEAPPGAIPLEHVLRAAAELEGPLRKAEAVAAGDAGEAEVERDLAEAERVAARLRPDLAPARLQEASSRELERLRQAVVREDLRLAGHEAALEQRSELLAGTGRELQSLLAAWQLTAVAAQREQAPPPVLRRVGQVAARLKLEEGRLRERQYRLLALQGRASDLRGGLADARASLDEADAALRRQLFEVESTPLWRAVARPEGLPALGAQIRQALREAGRDLGEFLTEEQARILLHLAVVVALGLGLLALRRAPAAPGEGEGEGVTAPGPTAQVLARPWSAALLLSLLLPGLVYPPLPPVARDLFALLLLGPLLRLLPGLLPPPWRRPLLGLAALVVLDRLAALAPPLTLLARLAVLLVTGLALAGLLGGLRRGGWARVAGLGGWGAVVRGAALLAAGLLAVSVASNLLGNATLAERLTHATLVVTARAAALRCALAVLEGALAALLGLEALRRRPLVARHRALLRRRAEAILRASAVGLWALVALVDFGSAEAVAAAGGALLGLRLKVGGLDVALGDLLAFSLTLALSLWLARAVRFLLDEGIFAELELPRGVPAAISTTVQYALVVLGCSWAVLASGMETGRFAYLIGAMGVGIGLGLQGIVNNLVSGLILLYERPIQVGDVVEVGLVTGQVTRIGVRSSTVRTFAGAEVILPNATLISAEVTNWTLSDRRRRLEINVGVAYGTEPARVVELLLAAVRGRPGVLEAPAPVALFLRFGESSIDFALRFWTADADGWQVLASDAMIEVHASLGRAGIEIPFPQRDLHLRSLDPAAARLLAGEAGGEAAGEPGATPGPAGPR